TMEHMYHKMGEISEKEKAYKEAFDIYNRVGDKSGIASAYNSLGRVWVKKGDSNKANDHFQQALRIASGVYRPAEIESYNQLGRLTSQQNQQKEALVHLNRAVTLARHARMNFELAENLLYLALAEDSLKQPSQVYIP